MGTFVVIDGGIWETNDRHQVDDACEAAAECGIDVLAQFDDTDSEFDEDYNPISGVFIGQLVARVYVTIPYSYQYADDHGDYRYCVIRARDAKHACELVSSPGGGFVDSDEWWTAYANEKGDSCESADGPDFVYKSWSCDCGDDDCYDKETGESSHDTQTECIQFQFAEAREFPTRDAAVDSNERGHEPAVEYLDT